MKAIDLQDVETIMVPPGLGFEYVKARHLKAAGLGYVEVELGGAGYVAEMSDAELALLGTLPAQRMKKGKKNTGSVQRRRPALG